jgi:3-methyladenine DNA glycosylase/8-oxoguanine DNA glycosylase
MDDDAPFELDAHGPFRLRAVAVSHGWFQTAPFSWDGEGDGRLGRVEALGGRAVTLDMAPRDGGVTVRASPALAGDHRAEAAGRVRRILQLGADLEGFPDAVRAVDPVLADDLAVYGGGRMLAGGSLFEDVVKGICGTNTTWRQAVGCINRIAALGRGGAFPDPAALLRAGEDHLREVARVGYRAPAIADAARAAIDGRLGEIEADSRAGDSDRVFAGLLGLRGIGPSTAGFVILLMGHYDRPSIDSATIRVAREAWFDGVRPTAKQVASRIAPAGDFRGLVLAWATLRAWQRDTGLG